jgi:hypothetical protein
MISGLRSGDVAALAKAWAPGVRPSSWAGRSGPWRAQLESRKAERKSRDILYSYFLGPSLFFSGYSLQDSCRRFAAGSFKVDATPPGNDEASLHRDGCRIAE